MPRQPAHRSTSSLRLVRKWRFSDEVARLLFSAECTQNERDELDRRIRQLDGDPIRHSEVILRSGNARYRRFVFGRFVAIITFDPSVPPHGEVRVLTCEPVSPSSLPCPPPPVPSGPAA